MLNDFAVGPLVLDFTNSAFDEKPAGGSTPQRFVASITVFPSMPCTLSRASAIAPPGTATTTASTFEMSPPSCPILVSSWPALSQRSASPPPTLPLPSTATFIALLPRFSRYHTSTQFPGMYLLGISVNRGSYHQACSWYKDADYQQRVSTRSLVLSAATTFLRRGEKDSVIIRRYRRYILREELAR